MLKTNTVFWLFLSLTMPLALDFIILISNSFCFPYTLALGPKWVLGTQDILSQFYGVNL